jgi:hypothetical protein
MITIEEYQDMKCPICATVVVDGDQMCKLPPCDHVRFISGNGEAFEFAEPGLEDRLIAKDNEDEDFDIWEALEKYMGPDGVILERVDEGMACGPTWFRIWVGIGKRNSLAACGES